MKRIFTLLATILFTVSLWAQSPEKMSYQAVIRDANNRLISYQKVGMRISILQGSANGTAVYVETQTPTTNANGMVSIEIGNGTVESGDFATIDWAKGPYFIKTETDPTGGTNYTITGTSQLLSVPYALHANTAETLSSTSNLATRTALGDSTAKLRSELQDSVSQISTILQDTASKISTTLAANTLAIQDTAAQIRADIPSVSGLATKTALGDSTALVRSEIPGQLADLSDVSTAAATSGNILVANGTQFKSVSVSGDITLGSDGAASIAPNSVNGSDIALGSDTKGDIMYYDGTNWVRLPAGTSGQVLQTNGSGSAPTWVTPSSGSSSTTKAVIEYSNYTVQSGVTAVIDKAASSITFTLPAAATAGSGFVLYFYSAYSTFSISTSGIIYNSNGTTGSPVSGLYSAILVSDGVNTWYQVK